MPQEGARSRSAKSPGRASCWRDCASSAAGYPRTSSSIGWKPMSGGDSFFDTSVVLYLLSSEEAKANRVEELLAESGVISVQVWNEFTAAASRKLGMPLDEIREVLNTVRAVCRTESLTVEDHDRATQIMERYKF